MENITFLALIAIFGFLFFGPWAKVVKKDDKKGGDKKEGGKK